MQHGAAGLGVAVPLGLIGTRGTTRLLAASGRPDSPTAPRAEAPENPDRALAALVAPIAVGTRLGSTCVSALRVDERNLGVVTVTDEHGRTWDAEIARRTDDDAALNPLCTSTHFSLYLRNGGTGHKPTDERVGLAVFGIADSVRRNEGAAPSLALASRAEVWAATGYRQNA